MLSNLLKSLNGKIDVTFSIDKKDVLTASYNNKEIIVDVKDPAAAIQIGLLELMKDKMKGSSRIKKLKEKGFSIKVKYKGFGFDL